MDPAIAEFLAQRRSNWLNKQSQAANEEKLSLLEAEADEKFSLEQWLPDAAKRACQLYFSTHPSKFSAPSAKTSTVYARMPQSPDGFLRTGNVEVNGDVFGNAAALDVQKFLDLILQDGKSVLNHLEQHTDYIQAQFHIASASFAELAAGFLSIYKENEVSRTHEKIKQVYFPVEDQYHLLSVLTPSGLLFELTDRIQSMRFSENTTEAREAKNKGLFHLSGYDEIYDLTLIGYGGTKPQNISVLNNRHAGKAYLLSSLPPVLEKRQVRLPARDFFSQTLYRRDIRQNLEVLNRLWSDEKNNLDVRQSIERELLKIWDHVLHIVFMLRQQKNGWSQVTLPRYQRLALDNLYALEREQEEEWAEAFIRDFVRWIAQSYEKILQSRAVILLSDHELSTWRTQIFALHLGDLK